MLESLKGFVFWPFRATARFVDARPSGRMIKQYAGAVRVKVVDENVVMVVPRAENQSFRVLEVAGLEKKNTPPEHRMWFAKGANAMLDKISRISRADIKEPLRLEKRARKIEKIQARAAKKEAKVAAAESPSTGVRVPPSLTRSRESGPVTETIAVAEAAPA